VRDFELIAFKCEWKHIYIAIILIRWSMPVNKLNYDVFTSYSLIEFNIPFNYFQILKTPNQRITVHFVYIRKSSLYSLYLANVYFKSDT
jgi:hypothetical protein